MVFLQHLTRVYPWQKANMVRLAESPTPTPSTGGCCFQACIILPICYCRQRVCILMRTRLLQEGARVIVANRLVWGGICARVCGSRQVGATSELAVRLAAGDKQSKGCKPQS